jgi:hypothetical protein
MSENQHLIDSIDWNAMVFKTKEKIKSGIDRFSISE